MRKARSNSSSSTHSKVIVSNDSADENLLIASNETKPRCGTPGAKQTMTHTKAKYLRQKMIHSNHSSSSNTVTEDEMDESTDRKDLIQQYHDNSGDFESLVRDRSNTSFQKEISSEAVFDSDVIDMPTFSSANEQLDFFCRLNVFEGKYHALPAHMKVSMVLQRLDNANGQLLGQALKLGYDHVRSFLCNSIIWSADTTAYDTELPAARSDLHRTITELDNLINCRDTDLIDDKPVNFIRKSLFGLLKRQEYFRALDTTNESIPKEAIKHSNELADNLHYKNVGRPSRVSEMTSNPSTGSNCAEHPHLNEESLSLNDNYYMNYISNTTPNCHCTCQDLKNTLYKYPFNLSVDNVGYLVPVHCGHNGWPGQSATESILQFMRTNGFDTSK